MGAKGMVFERGHMNRHHINLQWLILRIGGANFLQCQLLILYGIMKR